MDAASRLSNPGRVKRAPGRATYLTDEQLEHFRQRILAMRTAVADQVNQFHDEAEADRERAESDLNHLHHIPEIDHDVLSRLSLRDLELLEALDRALERIDAKTYGMCRVTGQPIPLERLEAVPYTDLSQQAEQEIEEGG